VEERWIKKLLSGKRMLPQRAKRQKLAIRQLSELKQSHYLGVVILNGQTMAANNSGPPTRRPERTRTTMDGAARAARGMTSQHGARGVLHTLMPGVFVLVERSPGEIVNCTPAATAIATTATLARADPTVFSVNEERKCHRRLNFNGDANALLLIKCKMNGTVSPLLWPCGNNGTSFRECASGAVDKRPAR
jgi:hypothetical protein